MSELRELLEHFEEKYKSVGGVIEQYPWGQDESGLSIATNDPKLFTAEAIAKAESEIGVSIPDEFLELWEWAGNRLIDWVDFGFLPPIGRSTRGYKDFDDIEGGRIASGFPELRPFPGLTVANQDRVKLVLSLEEHDYGHLWIWRGGFVSWIEHSSWTNLNQFIEAQIRWLDGPFVASWLPQLKLDSQFPERLAHLEIPDVVAHALSLKGPEHYWY